MTIALSGSEVMLGGIGTRQKFSGLHLMIGLDVTGSTGPFTVGVTKVIEQVVKTLPGHIAKLILGLYLFRDLEHDPDHTIRLGDDLAPGELIKQLSLLDYHGGGDELETQVDAVLDIATNTSWQSSAGTRLAILLVTSSGSKNARDGSDAPAVGARLGALGIKVVVIAPASASNVHELATFSGGANLALSNNPAESDLQSLFSRLTKSLTQIASSGNTTLNLAGASFGRNGTVAI